MTLFDMVGEPISW